MLKLQVFVSKVWQQLGDDLGVVETFLEAILSPYYIGGLI